MSWQELRKAIQAAHIQAYTDIPESEKHPQGCPIRMRQLDQAIGDIKKRFPQHFAPAPQVQS